VYTVFTPSLEDTTMLQNSRLKHLLAAGILTGLVFAILIAFAWRDTSRANANTTKTTATLPLAESEGVDALQAENEQLRYAFATMRAREKDYQTQLETANRTILQLQDVAATRRHDDHDDHEKHEHAYKQRKDKHD
jgi:hypothetical protein